MALSVRTITSIALRELDATSDDIVGRIGRSLVPIRNLGDGVIATLLHLRCMDLLRGGVLVIEDLEAALHPRTFVPLAVELCKRAAARSNQLVVTTRTASMSDAFRVAADQAHLGYVCHELRLPPSGVLAYTSNHMPSTMGE